MLHLTECHVLWRVIAILYFILAPLHHFDNISFHSFIPITFAASRSFTCCRLFRATNLFISMQPALNMCTAASDGTVPLHFRIARVLKDPDNGGAQCGNKRYLTGGLSRRLSTDGAGPPTLTNHHCLNDMFSEVLRKNPL